MVLYTKSNPHRLPQFQIVTRIERREKTNTVIVTKKAATQEARAHIESLLVNFHRLQQAYSLDYLHIAKPIRESDDVVQFEYIDEQTLQQKIVECLYRKDKKAVLAVVQSFSDLIHGMAVPFEETATQKKEEDIFSNITFSQNLVLIDGCIDYNFDNITLSPTSGQYTIFDYEWSVPGVVPIQFVLWRALFYAYAQLEVIGIKQLCTIDEWFQIAGITADDERAAVRAEVRFQESLSTSVLDIQEVERYFIDSLRQPSLARGVTKDITNRIQQYDTVVEELQHARVHIQNIENNNTTLHQAVENLQENIQTLQQSHSALQKNLEGLLEESQNQKDSAQKRLSELEKQITLMEQSHFWKLRGHYIRIKSFRLRHVYFLLRRAQRVYVDYGATTVLRYIFLYLKHGRSYFQQSRVDLDEYTAWREKNESYKISAIKNEISQWSARPVVSILVPVYNTDPVLLRACIESVQRQWYSEWELCLHDDASTRPETLEFLREIEDQGDSRIHVSYADVNGHISQATNNAFMMASGELVGLLDADDELSAWALYKIIESYQKKPQTKIWYSDEDKLNEAGERVHPFFKPDWSPDLLLSMNYTTHFSVYQSDLFRELNGMRLGFEGAQDHDLMLRAVERVDEDAIVHIPAVLYHWRMTEGSTATGVGQKNYAHDNGKKAIHDALMRRGQRGIVEDGMNGGGRYRVRYEIAQQPSVVIVVPFRDQVNLLQQCISSVLEKTTYKNYEILLVDNESKELETKQFLKKIIEHPQVRVSEYPYPFNYSAINNFAADSVDAEYVVFLNNDTEVISPEWLTAMIELSVQRPDVAAVGAMLLFENTTVQHAGVVLGVGGVAGHAFKYSDNTLPGYFSQLQLIRNVSAVTGACMLVRKSVFHDIGGFDEKNLPVSFNDVDLCLRIRQAGYHILYTPYARLFHYESLSRGDEGQMKHTDPEKFERLQKEIQYMKDHWNNALLADPYYNPHLSLVHEDYRIRV